MRLLSEETRRLRWAVYRNLQKVSGREDLDQGAAYTQAVHLATTGGVEEGFGIGSYRADTTYAPKWLTQCQDVIAVRRRNDNGT